MEKFVREGDVWLWTLIKGGVDLNQEYRHPQQPQHENLGFTSFYIYIPGTSSYCTVPRACSFGTDLCSSTNTFLPVVAIADKPISGLPRMELPN